MILKIKQVNQLLSAYSPIYRVEGTPNLSLKAIVPYKPDMEYDNSTLYVGKVDSFPDTLPRNFVNIGGILPPKNWAPTPDINLIILPRDTDFSEVLMLLCNRLMADDDSRMAAFSTGILSRLSSADNFSAIVEMAYQYFENPIIISDKNWRSMVMYPDLDIPEDMDWMQFRHDGMLSSEIVTQNMRANLAEILSTATAPFYWKDERMAYPRLFCTVSVAKHSAATISILEYNRPISEQDYTFLNILADAMSTELQKKESLGFSRGLKYEEFLADMLDGTLTSPAIINDRVKTLNINLHKQYLLYVVDIGSFDSGNFSVSYFRDYLERVVSKCKALVYRHYIVLFKGYPRAKNVKTLEELEAGKDLCSFLLEHNAICGVSRYFDQITDIRAAFHQAEEAISIGQRMGQPAPFYFYDDLELYHIAKICCEHEDVLKLCHPKLLELVEYDRKHNTSFTKSLRAWFANSRNITRTANALNLHRNSTIYHIKKIEEILGFTLGDADTLLYLELSFLLLEYNDKLFD